MGYAGRSEESSDSDFSTSEKDKCDKQSISSLSETPSKRPHRSMYRSANEESSDMVCLPFCFYLFCRQIKTLCINFQIYNFSSNIWHYLYTNVFIIF